MYIVCVHKYNTPHISRHSVKKTSLYKSCVLLRVSHLQTWQARAGKVSDRKGWGGAEETVRPQEASALLRASQGAHPGSEFRGLPVTVQPKLQGKA